MPRPHDDDDHEGLEARLGKLAAVYGHEGQVDREQVAALALLGLGAEGHFAVGGVVVNVVVGHGGRLACGSRLNVVVVAVNNDDIVDPDLYLVAVLVLHEDVVLALETGHDAAAGFAQKSYFISYFHNCMYFLFTAGTAGA